MISGRDAAIVLLGSLLCAGSLFAEKAPSACPFECDKTSNGSLTSSLCYTKVTSVKRTKKVTSEQVACMKVLGRSAAVRKKLAAAFLTDVLQQRALSGVTITGVIGGTFNGTQGAGSPTSETTGTGTQLTVATPVPTSNLSTSTSGGTFGGTESTLGLLSNPPSGNSTTTTNSVTGRNLFSTTVATPAPGANTLGPTGSTTTNFVTSISGDSITGRTGVLGITGGIRNQSTNPNATGIAQTSLETATGTTGTAGTNANTDLTQGAVVATGSGNSPTTTVTGPTASTGTTSAISSSGSISAFASLPVSPPVSLTVANIEIADTAELRAGCGTAARCLASAQASARCGGTAQNPTAPSGILCIYPFAVANAANISASPVFGGNTSRDFQVTWDAANGPTQFLGTWAYTVP